MEHPIKNKNFRKARKHAILHKKIRNSERVVQKNTDNRPLKSNFEEPSILREGHYPKNTFLSAYDPLESL